MLLLTSRGHRSSQCPQHSLVDETSRNAPVNGLNNTAMADDGAATATATDRTVTNEGRMRLLLAPVLGRSISV